MILYSIVRKGYVINHKQKKKKPCKGEIIQTILFIISALQGLVFFGALSAGTTAYAPISNLAGYPLPEKGKLSEVILKQCTYSVVGNRASVIHAAIGLHCSVTYGCRLILKTYLHSVVCV